jgi:predicted aminopeptidase
MERVIEPGSIHRKSSVIAVLRAMAVSVIGILLCSCYVTAQGAHYLGLRSKAVPVAQALRDPQTSPEVRVLLERVGEIRKFAIRELGLKDTKSYTSIAKLDSDRLVTVVSACAELSFDRFMWRYPLVGRFPFRGYFIPSEAEEEVARLKARGFDTIARPVEAFSTLGWITDPLFSYMARYSEAEIADLILQETTHATIFVKGQGNFDEEISAFVGNKGSLLWLESKYGEHSPQVDELRKTRADDAAFSDWLLATAEELQKDYASSKTIAEKRAQKAAIIATRAAEFKSKYSQNFVSDDYKDFPMETLNNAYIDLYRIYQGEPELYKDYYERICASSLKRFVAEVARIVRHGGDPRDGMRKELAAG